MTAFINYCLLAARGKLAYSSVAVNMGQLASKPEEVSDGLLLRVATKEGHIGT